MKKFYNEVGGFLSPYLTPTTIAFNLTRELEILAGRRSINEARVKELMRSYETDGEFSPILIRVWVRDRRHARPPRLIDGAHRLEAARRLGLSSILVWMVECSDDEAKAMEIAANAFRAELTSAERGRLMIEWCRLNGLPVPGEEGMTVHSPGGAGSQGDDPHADGELVDDTVAEVEKLETPFQFPGPPADPGSIKPAATDDQTTSRSRGRHRAHGADGVRRAVSLRLPRRSTFRSRRSEATLRRRRPRRPRRTATRQPRRRPAPKSQGSSGRPAPTRRPP